LDKASWTGRQADWIRGQGPMSDLVVSSRVRLARNVGGMPFLSRCSDSQRSELAQGLSQTLTGLALPEPMQYIDVEHADELERRLLVERHLISRNQAEATGPRGVAFTSQETLAAMVNEEDHLRLQALRGGLQLEACYDDVRRLDDLLEQHISYAFSSRFGYLTACPTNVGTALRVGVMLHLPAMKMTGELEKALRAARDMNLAVRGLHGEGTEALGDFFQVSNQSTLGRSEEQIIADFREQIVPAFITYEKRSRDVLLKERKSALEDKVFRAWAVLRAARLMSSEETLYLLSHIRLGVALQMLPGLTIELLNQLSLLTQPAHLQQLAGKPMTAPERGEYRAKLLRDTLGAVKGVG
jgi:protein arginine kinase